MVKSFSSNCFVCDEHVGTRAHNRRDVAMVKGVCDCCAVHIFKVRYPGSPVPEVKECTPVIKPLEGEKFKKIAAYPNYLISSSGRVINDITNRDMKPRTTSVNGPKSVMLYSNGVGVGHRVHRLVAAAFMKGYNPVYSVDFKDGNKSNSHISNLRQGTKKVKR